MKQSEPIYLGIDIGGTKVASGLVNGDGDVLYKTRVPMISNRDAATGFAAVRDAIDAALAANRGSLLPVSESALRGRSTRTPES